MLRSVNDSSLRVQRPRSALGDSGACAVRGLEKDRDILSRPFQRSKRKRHTKATNELSLFVETSILSLFGDFFWEAKEPSTNENKWSMAFAWLWTDGMKLTKINSLPSSSPKKAKVKPAVAWQLQVNLHPVSPISDPHVEAKATNGSITMRSDGMVNSC